MPIEESKPSQNQKSQKDKKSSELRDEDLRSVSGGLTNRGGLGAGGTDSCITQTP